MDVGYEELCSEAAVRAVTGSVFRVVGPLGQRLGVSSDLKLVLNVTVLPRAVTGKRVQSSASCSIFISALVLSTS
jgi:hypothetical protein